MWSLTFWNDLSKLQMFLMILTTFWWGVLFFLTIIALVIAKTRYSRQPQPISSRLPPSQVPPVSVLRPLKGIDVNLVSNLESIFLQDYPHFEIIFSVSSDSDPVIPLVRELMAKYSRVDSTLIIGDRVVGVNPKINNLIRSYETAKYDYLWVCDSNVNVSPGCLGRSIDLLTRPNVGLVHHLPFAVEPTSFGSRVEQVFLDTVHAKMYLAINFVAAASCVMGKSCLYRRSDLERAGGLIQFAKYMAEDNLIAEALWNQGLSHEMTCDMACQSLGPMSFSEYWQRRSRWVRVRKYIVTSATLTEPFTESIVCGLLGAYGFHLLTGIHRALFFALHMLFWFTADLVLYRTFIRQQSQQPNPMPFHQFLLAWLTRELAALPLYVSAMCGHEISWRGGLYKILLDGSAVPTSPSKPHSFSHLFSNKHLGPYSTSASADFKVDPKAAYKTSSEVLPLLTDGTHGTQNVAVSSAPETYDGAVHRKVNLGYN